MAIPHQQDRLRAAARRPDSLDLLVHKDTFLVNILFDSEPIPAEATTFTSGDEILVEQELSPNGGE